MKKAVAQPGSAAEQHSTNRPWTTVLRRKRLALRAIGLNPRKRSQKELKTAEAP